MILKYFKGEPNTYVIRYKNGVVKKEGVGLTFWYWPHVVIQDIDAYI